MALPPCYNPLLQPLKNSLVDGQHAWVEDPAAADRMAESGGGEGLEEESPVLTLAALQRELAVVRGHAALAAAMPGLQQGHASLSSAAGGGGGRLAEQLAGGDAEDVFAQLLALGECPVSPFLSGCVVGGWWEGG